MQTHELEMLAATGRPNEKTVAANLFAHLSPTKNRRKVCNDSPSTYTEGITMQYKSKRLLALAKGFVFIAFTAILVAAQASGQTDPGWVTLLDGKKARSSPTIKRARAPPT
jgi:hypothetical protein